MDNNPRDDHVQQPPYKRQNVARDYNVGPIEKKEYAGTLHLNHAAAHNQRSLTCFECGNQGHYKSDCPELKNQNQGNQAGSSGARGRVCALGGGETEKDPNNIEDDIDA
ncbi:reverse transcriptase domain-containing protein [Tanacetum coccineum]